MNKNITIWCSYHDINLIDEYNLNSLDKNIYQLFNTNDINLNRNSINHLNKYLNEYCTLYYIWQNKIYSPYVGFCHYKRVYDINTIDYDRLSNDEIQAYEIYNTPSTNIFDDINYIGLGWYVDIILTFIKENYMHFYYKAIHIFFDNNVDYKKKLIRESFICKWDIFDNLMKFTNSFLEFLLNDKLQNFTINKIDKLCLKFNVYQYDLWEEFLKEKEITDYSGDFLGYHRNMAFLIEYIIELYFLIFHENRYFTIS